MFNTYQCEARTQTTHLMESPTIWSLNVLNEVHEKSLNKVPVQSCVRLKQRGQKGKELFSLLGKKSCQH